MRINKITELIRILEENGLEELEIKGLFSSIRVTKRVSRPITHLPPIEEKIVEKNIKEKTSYIKAPMVGTFYHSSSPTTPPYVEIGSKVTTGKIVCIIEAMKVMNEIESDMSGTIVEILVKNKEPVEYGQPLFRIEVDE
ncbi:MAG: acetyl-CoA carboxylase biotin carboxyl carrier protein [Candidatus Stahlbacteria bacterium]|nr:acetyl-CoA carboxylase biotin carboxyl carrier protein [Candidatus Stahlbacteria bacterium]